MWIIFCKFFTVFSMKRWCKKNFFFEISCDTLLFSLLYNLNNLSQIPQSIKLPWTIIDVMNKHKFEPCVMKSKIAKRGQKNVLIMFPRN